jgi:sugar lactone lactonase YvrE
MEVPGRSAVLLLACLAGACAGAAPSLAANIGITDRWDTGHPTGPAGLVATADGFVYVADGVLDRVEKFTWSGQPVLSFGTVDSPLGVAVDSTGDIYVTHSRTNRVRKFSPDGQVLDTWSGFEGPSGITVDSADSVYVGDAHGIQKFDTGGRLLLRWPALEPVGLAVGPDGRVYATASAFVHVYGSDGTPLGHFLPRDPRAKYPDGEGLFDPNFGGATSVAVTRRGDIWAADPGNSRLQRFGGDGEFRTACGKRGAGRLRLVSDVAASGDQLFAAVVGQVVRLGPVARAARRCDDTAPRAEGMAVRPRVVGAAVAGKRIAVTMELSEAAVLRVTLSRHRAVLARRRISVRAGARHLLLRRLTGRRTLPPGSYRLRIRATDPSGNTARVAPALEFRVLGA